MGIRKFVIEFVFWREPPLEVGYTFVTLIFHSNILNQFCVDYFWKVHY